MGLSLECFSMPRWPRKFDVFFSWFIRKFTICDCFNRAERRTVSKGGLNGWFFHCTWKSREVARNYDWIRKQLIIIVNFGLHSSSILHAMLGFLIQMPHFRSINRYESWIIHTFKATPVYWPTVEIPFGFKVINLNFMTS